ncbi:relaxase/mobilization nuclease domain-containing protein [Verrucosispora sp. TAA-831]|uniref:relaxase/mobilization nuclease domain-containing protein n=1 Tax=Verrucosispora sp. TAA-831 TaxID=3422227 RepID=UPI003D6F1F8D
MGGLLRYLFGPGKREEHVRPRVVAAWDGSGPLDALQPPERSGGWHDVRGLTNLLEQPVRAGFRAPSAPVWHASIRNHPTDRILSDAQWAHIAAEVIAAVGLAPHGDVDAVRWVAVRHNDDHVHVVATLVRQDRRTVWPWQDKRKAQAACRDLEQRYGLYRVAPPGKGSRRWPSPAELNKAARLRTASSSTRPGRETGRAGRGVAPRERLRRRVREAAAVATDERDFFARLAQAGVRVKLRRGTRDPEQVTGYAVGLDGHRTATGDTVWYGGGRLAPDLTLPQLRSRWTETPPTGRGGNAARVAATGIVPPDVSRRAAETVRDAHEAMRAASSPLVASAIASAAADLLTATATAWEGREGGPLSDAADWFDRAAHDLHGRASARRVSQASHLRAMARLIAATGTVSRDRDTVAALHLVFTVAALAESLADLRKAQDRLHQARAARHAAGHLPLYHPPAGTADARTPDARAARPPTPDPPSLDRRGRQR